MHMDIKTRDTRKQFDVTRHGRLVTESLPDPPDFTCLDADGHFDIEVLVALGAADDVFGGGQFFGCEFEALIAVRASQQPHGFGHGRSPILQASITQMR